MMIRLKTAIFWIVVTAAFAYGLGWQLSRTEFSLRFNQFIPKITVQSKEPPSGLAQADFKMFWDVWGLLEEQYIDKKSLNPQKMVEGAILGMVNSVGDPYTTFLPPQQNKSAKEDLEGSFEGVGIQLGYKDKKLVVVAPLKDTPADKAGVKAGDYIQKIDGKDTNNLSVPEAVNNIRGPQGSQVSLTIIRDDESKPLEISLVRGKIRIKSVELSFQKDAIAYLKLTRFGDNTDKEWREAVDEIVSNESQALVLDLRNNPGGYLEGAVVIGSEFFSDGIVVQKEHSSGRKEERNVRSGGRLLEIPVVILINKGSASASEIVAGALQDRKRGIIVGEQSFGKGTIQEVRELTQGAGLHITTEKWLLPSGKWINGTGLTPDIVVANSDKEGEDTQLNEALKKAKEFAQKNVAE